MYTTQSRIHRRWMGNHSLVGLTLLGDLIGAGLTYLAGGLLIPFIGSLLSWLIQALFLILQRVLKALQPDTALYICVGVGALIGLLLALGVGGVLDGPYTVRHKNPVGRSLFAFVATLLAALFCWVLIAQFLHSAPMRWPPALTFQQSINLPCAIIWLLYYAVIRGFSLLTASGKAITTHGQCLYRYALTPLPVATPTPARNTPQEQQLMLVKPRETSIPPPLQASVPISRAHPGGPKWGHLENCYKLYHKALNRFDPPPFTLKTPDGFRYYDGGGQHMYWYKHTLLIPKDFLEPAWRHALLPELARQLMYYNAPDLRVFELLNSYPDNAVATFFFMATLNFIWVPVIIKNIAGERWQGERVLDSDIYACKTGEAMRLRARLRAEQEALHLEGLVDGLFPTLEERLEQLNAFITEEARQLKKLGYPIDTAQKVSPHVVVNPQLATRGTPPDTNPTLEEKKR